MATTSSYLNFFTKTNRNELIEAFYKTYKNIGDFRHLGAGKTTDANQLSVLLANEGKKVLRIMPNYKICEENASKIPGSFIFKGRTQPNMCEFLENYPEILDLIAGRYLCRYCQKRKCNYKKQYDELNKNQIIFSVYQNLPVLLQKCKPNVVVIDDVSINHVIHHKEDFTFDAIRCAKIYHGYSEEALNKLFDYLLTDRYTEAIAFIRENKKLIEDEIKRTEKDIVEEYKNSNNKNKKEDIKRYLKVLAVLYEACKKPENEPLISSYVRGEKHFIRICWSDWILRKYKVIWQTSTPTMTEKQTFAELGEYETLVEDAKPNHNWHVIQLSSAKYAKTTAKKSDRFSTIINLITRVILKITQFIMKETVLFSARELLDNSDTMMGISEDDSDLFIKIGHYERESTSTNSYSHVKSGVVAGILFKAEIAYRQKPFIRNPDDKVDENIKNDEMGSIIKQELGRIFRGDRNVKKFAVVITSIDIGDGYIPEIGAVIEKYRNFERELEWDDEAKEWRATGKIKWLKRLRDLLREIYADDVIAECGNRILNMLEQQEKVKVNDVAKRFERETEGFYSKSWFREQITNNEFLQKYNLKKIKIKEGKRRGVDYITRR